MVLVLNGVLQAKCPQDTQSLYNAHPVYRETAGQLLAIPIKVIGPVGLLYVQQREFAATVPHDKNVSIIGSDGATTCIIVVVRHSGSGGDSSGSLRWLRYRRSRLYHGAEGAGVGLRVPRRQDRIATSRRLYRRTSFSEELFFNLMTTNPVEIDLTLACVGQLNSTIRGGIPWPVVYGVGVNIKTGEIFPATFPEKGPEECLRRARHLTGVPQVLDIYDCGLGLLRIGPFNYKPLRGVDLWLEQSDEFILQHLSTSPDVEPPTS
ncbi:hypothetical protein NQ318_015176 [Aromia moschata]|uniref:Uncharacterized protein n=1 Tax=Aromia moschata TaxID=1265417 RepID=A0AAV8XZI1_9CUCU|nr:hypothetical protein NQ318_015176 [Aromia moschata]